MGTGEGSGTDSEQDEEAWAGGEGVSPSEAEPWGGGADPYEQGGGRGRVEANSQGPWETRLRTLGLLPRPGWEAIFSPLLRARLGDTKAGPDRGASERLRQEALNRAETPELG